MSNLIVEAPPDRPPPSPWTVSDVILAIPLSVVLAGMIAFGLGTAILPLLPAHQSGLRTAVESLILQASLYAGLVGAVVGLLRVRRRVSTRVLGWTPVPASWVVGAVPLTLGAFALVAIADAIGSGLFPGAHNGQPTAVRGEFGHNLLVAVVAVSVIAPIAEETFFRGFLFGWLRGRVPLWLAVGASSLVFAVAHGELALLLPTFVLGCLLALVYHRSGSLVPGMIVHAMFNLVGITSILGPTH